MKDELVERMLDEYSRKQLVYKGFTEALKDYIRGLLLKHPEQSHIALLESRTKTIDSLSTKLAKEPGKYATLTDVTDLSGVRIVTTFEDDVHPIAYLISRFFEIDWSRSINKQDVLRADQFGYRSLHYIVRLNADIAESFPEEFRYLICEVQMRSILQHAWSLVSHAYGYKKEDDVPRRLKRRYARIASLLELGDNELINIRQEVTTEELAVPLIRAQGVCELAPDLEVRVSEEELAGGSDETILKLTSNARIMNRIRGNNETDVIMSARFDEKVQTIAGLSSGSNGLCFPVRFKLGYREAELVIRGLRLNASGRAVHAQSWRSPVSAILTAESASRNPQVIKHWQSVCYVVNGLVFHLEQAKSLLGPTEQEGFDWTMCFAEGFSNAFKSIEDESSTASADSGTRLSVVFTGIPDETQILVSDGELQWTRPPRARFSEDAAVAEVSGVRARRLAVTNRTARAEWEWTARKQDSPARSCSFGLKIICKTPIREADRQILCQASLGPGIRPGTTISEGAVPRFVNSMAPCSFSI